MKHVLVIVIAIVMLLICRTIAYFLPQMGTWEQIAICWLVTRMTYDGLK